jgi:transposase
MNLHKNARLTPYVEGNWCAGERVSAVAHQLGVSRRTAYKWIVRYRAEGPAGLTDRSSRPHSSHRQTAAAIALGMKVRRMQQWTCAEIAHAVGGSAATAARVLRRAGLSRRGRLSAPPMAQRSEHPRPGELVHLDMKKLGRIVGVGTGLQAAPATSTCTTGLAGSTRTAESTIIPAWPTSRAGRTRAPRAPERSCAAPSAGVAPRVFTSGESRLTTGRRIVQTAFALRVGLLS